MSSKVIELLPIRKNFTLKEICNLNFFLHILQSQNKKEKYKSRINIHKKVSSIQLFMWIKMIQVSPHLVHFVMAIQLYNIFNGLEEETFVEQKRLEYAIY